MLKVIRNKFTKKYKTYMIKKNVVKTKEKNAVFDGGLS